MKKWVKRYFILGLCFIIALLPIFSILNQFDFFKEGPTRIIVISILGGLVLIYFVVMTILMLRHNKKGNE